MGLFEKLTKIKSEAGALLTYANETTGNDDSSLGEAVHTLADGYGQGGENGIIMLCDLKITCKVNPSSRTVIEKIPIKNDDFLKERTDKIIICTVTLDDYEQVTNRKFIFSMTALYSGIVETNGNTKAMSGTAFINYHDGNKITRGSGGYGVFCTRIYDGNIEVEAQYNSTYGNTTGTYTVKAYAVEKL